LENPIKVKVLLPGGMNEAFWYDLGVVHASDMGIGSIVEVPLHSKIVPGVVMETGSPTLEFKTRPISGLAPNFAKVPQAWIELLQWLSIYYSTPLPQVFAACLPKSAMDFLFGKKPSAKIRKIKTQTKAIPNPGISLDASNPALGSALIPTPEQKMAIEVIQECFNPFRFQTYLLHGVTGSGKTLVYLHLARQALAKGRRVLVLLPEIALTPQTLERFRAFLDRPVLALHSNLSAMDRRELWRAIFAGEADVIVGARSAVLCPIDNLGLIVVDEEHDGSYKQSDASPRYNARDLALYRGRQEGCPVILGSATPSLESYYSALSGKYQLLELQTRATGSIPPRIRIVDMREQYQLQGSLLISIPLREAVQKALDAGEQAILFLNRRGYAHRRVCKSCGEPRQCPHCIAPLVYHKAKQAMLCHYCGFNVRSDAPCLKCSGTTWLDVGRGIEKVEEYLQSIFPSAAIARLDRDSTSTLGGAEKILSGFKRGEFHILLGTQMVAKGHDFPKVNLVGVVDADAGLGLSDFRAQERAFQLITQVSGRAGRHQNSGEVFLQTYKPENPLLGFALAHDYGSYYRSEIDRRRELDYPPFRKLLLVEITGSDEKIVDEHMHQFADAFQHFADQADVIILGPAFAVMKKIKDQFRAQIIGKGKAPNQLQWAFQQALERYKPKDPQKTKLRVDMDPLSML
jgi:primosomal protein N' (replication factor Y) (superfamily II helicase)